MDVEVLRTQQLEIVDSEGQVRAELHADQGSVTLSMHDKSGKLRLMLMVDDSDDTPSLTFHDDDLNPRVLLSLDEERNPSLDLSGGPGRGSVVAAVDLAEDGPSLCFMRGGKVTWSAP